MLQCHSIFGKEVLLVGGTPLYLKSLLRGVCEGPPADPEFRREVVAEVNCVGIEALRERLELIDPAHPVVSAIDRSDPAGTHQQG